MTVPKIKFLKTLVCLLIFISTFSANVNAQEKTPYQKRIEQLNRKLLIDIGVSKSLIDLAMKSGDNMAETIMLFSEGRNALSAITRTQEGKALIFMYVKLFEEAAKLKNEVDYKRDEVEHKRDKEKKEKEEYEKSDKKYIKDRIKDEFNYWLQKGEFEKSVDYPERIKNDASKVFDSICYNTVVLQLRRFDHIEPILLNYNPDTEKFGIKIHGSIIFYDPTFDQIDSLKVPLNKAIDFKNRFHELKAIVDENYLVFANNNFKRLKIILGYRQNINSTENSTEEYYEVIFSPIGTKKIQFTTADLGINLQEGMNLKFDYENYHSGNDFSQKSGSISSSSTVNTSIAGESIIAKCIAAVGGDSVIAIVKDMKITGSYERESVYINGETINKGYSPKLFTLTQKFILPTYFEMSKTDGSTKLLSNSINIINGIYEKVQNGKVVPVNEDEKEELDEEVSIYKELYYQKNKYTYSVKSIANIDGQDAYEVEIKSPNGRVFTNYYDVKTGLKVKTTYSEMNKRGDKEMVVTNLSNYKAFNGLKRPTRIVSFVGSFIGTRTIFNIYDVEINTGLKTEN